MLFGPLAKIQKQRDALTKGARKTAEESLASAERKTTDFENKLRDARAEVYREQEEMRKKWLADQAEQIEQAREKIRGCRSRRQSSDCGRGHRSSEHAEHDERATGGSNRRQHPQ